MKLTAKVVPYSSVVGSSVTLHDEAGAVVAIVMVSVPRPSLDYKEVASPIIEKIAAAFANSPTSDGDAGAEPVAWRGAVRLLHRLMQEKPFNEQPWARMALAIGAKAIMRGRLLTEAEKLQSLITEMNNDTVLAQHRPAHSVSGRDTARRGFEPGSENKVSHEPDRIAALEPESISGSHPVAPPASSPHDGGEIERLTAKLIEQDAVIAALAGAEEALAETRAAVIEECAKVAELYADEPVRKLTDLHGEHEAGAIDSAIAIAAAIRALSTLSSQNGDKK
jgi:hypothetical protein